MPITVSSLGKSAGSKCYCCKEDKDVACYGGFWLCLECLLKGVELLMERKEATMDYPSLKGK